MTRRTVLLACAAAVVIGLVVLLRSPALGQAAGHAWLVRQDGLGGDTGNYQLIVAGYIENYRLIGAILFGGGSLGLVLNTRSSGQLP